MDTSFTFKLKAGLKTLINKSAARELGMQPAFQKSPFLEYSIDTGRECHGMMQA